MHAEHELFQLEIRYFCTNEMQKKKKKSAVWWRRVRHKFIMDQQLGCFYGEVVKFSGNFSGSF